MRESANERTNDTGNLTHQIELRQVECFPRNNRVVSEGWLYFFPVFVQWSIDLLQFSRHGISDNSRPCVVGLAKRDRVSVPGFIRSAERFIRDLGHVRTATHDFR